MGRSNDGQGQHHGRRVNHQTNFSNNLIPFASVHPSLLTSSALLLSTTSRFLASASRDLIRCSFFRVSFFSCATSRDLRASSTFFWFASDLRAAVGSDTIQCVNDRKHVIHRIHRIHAQVSQSVKQRIVFIPHPVQHFYSLFFHLQEFLF